MERRLLTFFVASTAFLVVYLSLRVLFDVPPVADPPGVEVLPDPIAAVDTPDGPPASEPAVTPRDSDVANDPVPGSTDVPVAPEGTTADPASAPVVPVRDQTRQWTTLGSMAPTSPYVMMVTLTNRGGGLERIELTQRDENGRLKYRRVDVRSGYLGYFAGQLASQIDGVLVNIVGDGTPAATAKADGISGGIARGDIIVAVGGVPVVTENDIERSLLETKPGDEVTVEVMRGDTAINFVATLSEHPLDLVRLARTGGTEEVDGNLSRLSCLMTLERVNRRGIPAGDDVIGAGADPTRLIWDQSVRIQDDSQSALYQLDLSDAEMQTIGGAAIGLKRSYTIHPGSYAIDLGLAMTNAADVPQDIAYRLAGANGITLEGWWYSNKISPNWGGAAARDIVYNSLRGGHSLISGFTLLKQAKNEPEYPDQVIFAPDGEDPQRTLRYIGVDAQYFTVAYVPPSGKLLDQFRRATAEVVAEPLDVPVNKERAVNVSFFLDSQVKQLAVDETWEQSIQLFAGPKQPELLAKYGLSECIYYGWFSWPAITLAKLLHGLYWFIGNYALAIVALTVIVRGLMFPLSRKAAINAQKMQELAPELKKIAEKYKDDMEGRLKAQRELQTRVGFNPLAGCLPMFFQLPIFIGLYRCLSVDIELRQAAFASWTTWASNLAGPDMLAYWGDWLWDYLSGRGTGWLGPYFNILPIVVMGLFLVQQKMFMPPATDEQTAMTQKIMTYMTLVMGLFFFRVPAGLCIYFITSSLWGICERVLVKRTLPTGKHFDHLVLDGTATPITPAVSKPSANQGEPAAQSSMGKLADRIRQRVSPTEEPAPRPGKRKRPVRKGGQ